MRIHLTVPLGLLAVSTASTLIAQTRTLDVRGLSSRDQYLTAHRLRLSTDEVVWARAALMRATALAEVVAGRTSIVALGDLWAKLDRSRAPDKVQSLIALLRETAATTREQDAYRLATQDARMLASSLMMLRPGGSGDALADWPQPPESQVDSVVDPDRSQTNVARYRHFQELAQRNLDAALGLLPELENGSIDPQLRNILSWQLAGAGRLEEAGLLVGEVIEAARSLPPDEALNSLDTALMYMFQYDPESLPETIPVWAESLRQLPPELHDNYRRMVPDSLDLSPLEARAAWTLSMMMQTAPDLARQALAHFPGLDRKLTPVGGLQGFRRARERTHPSRPAARTTGGRALTPETIAASLQETQTDEDRVRRLHQLAGDASRYYSGPDYDPEADRRALESLRSAMHQLESPLGRYRAFRLLAQHWMELEGRLSNAFLQDGLELLDDLHEARPDQPGAEAGALSEDRLASLETALLAARAWAARPREPGTLEELDEALRFGVHLKLLEWMLPNHVGRRAFRF